MKRRFLLWMVAVSLLGACRDEFNDPNPDYEEIIDETAPEIIPISLAQDSTYRGLDTLPLLFDVKDDHLLGSYNINLVTINVSSPGLKYTVNLQDSFFHVDTFFVLPPADTTTIQMVIGCDDYAGNSSIESFNLTAIP